MFGRGPGLSRDLTSWRRNARVTALLAPAAAILGLSAPAFAETAPVPPSGVPSIERRVDRFVAAVEARRNELGVPGAALVVVQGDRIVRIAGLGHRRLDPAEPVTQDTVFALASVTKQFTAVAVALAVSEGKLAFEDRPGRFVPSFHFKDPEADAKANFIDLLAHRTGLGRSDLFLLAPFTQDEMFALAGRAEPAAKLRERFIYNNTMYALAGAAVGRAYGTSYERFMEARILKPLGMAASSVTLAGLTGSPDRATGYIAAGGGPKPVPAADVASIAGAGAINSSARDMAAWLRFLNARGQGETLKIAPAAYARIFEVHLRTSAAGGYGFGFELALRGGVLVASHGGNLPGFSNEVVHVPDRGLSFALLTNLNATPLTAAAQTLFWDLVVKPELPAAAAPPATPPAPTPGPAAPAGPPIASELLIGTYFATVGGTFDVKKTDSGLAAVFAGQPPYALKVAGVNVYGFTGLDGFSVAFSESSAMPGRLTVLLRQPATHAGGNIAFVKKDDAWLVRAKAQHAGPEAELIGHYHSADRSMRVEIVPYRAGLALMLTAPGLKPLANFGGDVWRLEGLPETHRLTLKRGGGNRVVGFVYEQPTMSAEMIAETAAASGDPAEARRILARAVAAAGGAEAIDRLVSRTKIGRAVAAAHGVDGRSEQHTLVGKEATLLTLGAFGKFVLNGRVVTNERESVAFAGTTRIPATGKAVDAARFLAVPHPLYRWQQRYASVAAAGETAVNGEAAAVVELTPPGLAPVRLYVSLKSHLILREETPTYVGDEAQPSRIGVDLSDYRSVNGVQVPFAAVVTHPLFGRIDLKYDRITLDAPIDPKMFE